MKYVYYNPVEGHGGCIYRSIAKSLNKSYNEVKEELDLLEKSMNTDNKKEVFEKYLLMYNYIFDDSMNSSKLLENSYTGNNIIFAYYNDWYHMICIIDNVLFDKYDEDKLKDLTINKIYKKK